MNPMGRDSPRVPQPIIIIIIIIIASRRAMARRRDVTVGVESFRRTRDDDDAG